MVRLFNWTTGPILPQYDFCFVLTRFKKNIEHYIGCGFSCDEKTKIQSSKKIKIVCTEIWLSTGIVRTWNAFWKRRTFRQHGHFLFIKLLSSPVCPNYIGRIYRFQRADQFKHHKPGWQKGLRKLTCKTWRWKTNTGPLSVAF